MNHLADALMVLAASAAALYCFVLSRRLRRLADLDSGIGAAVAQLAASVEETRRVMAEARTSTAETEAALVALSQRAETAATQLRLLLAALPRTPEASGPAPAPDAARVEAAAPSPAARPAPGAKAGPAAGANPRTAPRSADAPRDAAPRPVAPARARTERDIMTGLGAIAAGLGRPF